MASEPADPAPPRVVRRRLKVVAAPDFRAGDPHHWPEAKAQRGEATLTAAQMREARRVMREKHLALRAERVFGERLAHILNEGQNAPSIAFGAILSAYIGNVLTVIDDKPFDGWLLAGFFILIGVFIGGLCVGNAIVLRRHYGLGASFLTVGGVAAWATLRTASALGFELPILQILFVCWIGMLVVTDALLTLIVYLHHRRA